MKIKFLNVRIKTRKQEHIMNNKVFKRLPLAVAVAMALPAIAQAQETRLGNVVVTAPPAAATTSGSVVATPTLQSLKPATSDSASLLRDVPGVSLYGSGGVSSLPSIRGLADDRIRIKVDGMDLIAACPNHMNPALSYLDPSNVGLLEVYPGISPVSVGGDSIAGTIVAESKAPVFAEAGKTLVTGEVGAFYRSNGNARGGNLGAAFASDSLSVSYSGSTAESENYDAARAFKTLTATGRAGHTLPLDEVGSTAYKSRNHELGFAFKGGDHLFEAKVGLQDIPYELWPNQRMDMLENDQKRLNLRYQGKYDWGKLEARAYHEKVEHFMDFGADKRFWYGGSVANDVIIGSGGPTVLNGTPCSPLSPACAAGMPMNTESKNTGFALKGDVNVSATDLVRVGAEIQRYRLDDWWPASGGGMWPNTFWNINDGERDRNAVFAEWEAQPSAQWTTLAGVRYERVTTDAGPVQAYNNAMAPATARVPAASIPGCCSNHCAKAKALRQCSRIRSASVSKPFNITHALNALSVGPAVRKKIKTSSRYFLAPTTAPPKQRPCPSMYLVAECTTISAPSFNGCCNAGVQKQLSTTNKAPAACAIFAIAATSATSFNGFEGVSKKNKCVLFCTAACHDAGSISVTKLTSTPNFCIYLVNNAVVVPNTLREHTT
jgi:outer membrane receptor protein involved in Fe transport